MGTKAGRQRYEQIVGTYRAVTGNPATRSMIDAGRRKLADRVSPDRDPKMVTLTEIDSETTVVEPRQPEVEVDNPGAQPSGMLMVWPGSIGPVDTPRPGLLLFGPPTPTCGVPM